MSLIYFQKCHCHLSLHLSLINPELSLFKGEKKVKKSGKGFSLFYLGKSGSSYVSKNLYLERNLSLKSLQSKISFKKR